MRAGIREPEPDSTMERRHPRRASRPLRIAALALLAAACVDGVGPDENGKPTILALTPSTVNQGIGAFTLTVGGYGFVASSVVRWNGDDRPTTFVSATQLTAEIAAADVAEFGAAAITVFNPAPGGGESETIALTIAPTTNPEPTLASIEPDSLEAGGGEATLTLTGTGFLSSAYVVLRDATEKEPTYVSPTELRLPLTAEDVADAGVVEVKVVNPEPGGGASETRTLTLAAPVPTLASIDPAEAEAGQDSLVVHVTGTGFVGNSVVEFEGEPRTARRISSTELEATLLAEDLRAAGSHALTVVNPAPGGGESGSATLELVNPVPVLELLPSPGANAGGTGFFIHVHGSAFVEGSVVRWNGTDRATAYVGPHRLQAFVSASDVASAGLADVTVVNPGPGGGTSDALTMTIRAFATPAVTDLQVLDVPANDLVYSAARDRFYASIPDTVATIGNSVVAIDPATGAITDTVFVGSRPDGLALSGDDAVLWVALDGTDEVRRIDLASLTSDLTFSLDGNRVDQMRVMPGSPGTLAIALQNTCCSPRHEGVAIYDDGEPRPLRTPGHTGSNSIVFGGDPSVLYGLNNETTEYGFRTMAVGPEGVETTDTTEGLVGTSYRRIEYGSGRVYVTDGAIIDPERRKRVGTFADDGRAVRPDPELGRAYFIDESGTVAAYDLNDFRLLGSVDVGAVAFGHPAASRLRLVRWGTDGLAFHDLAHIYILRTTIASP